MHDGWDDGLLTDDPPWFGIAALLIGTAAVTAGALTAAGACAVIHHLWIRNRR